jgi:hypothetical protein
MQQDAKMQAQATGSSGERGVVASAFFASVKPPPKFILFVIVRRKI